MEWIEIDLKNLPKREVLAANFESGTYGYKEKIIGYVSLNGYESAICENEDYLLENATHYIPINDFDI